MNNTVKSFGFEFVDAGIPRCEFDFVNGTLEVQENKTPFHALDSEVFISFPDGAVDILSNLRRFLEQSDVKGWFDSYRNDKSADKPRANFRISVKTDHLEGGTSIAFESIAQHERLYELIMQAIGQIAHLDELSKSSYNWPNVFKVLKDGWKYEIKDLRCPVCGGELSFIYDGRSKLTVRCGGSCGSEVAHYDRGELPNCVRYFGNESNIVLPKPTEESRDSWDEEKKAAKSIEKVTARCRVTTLRSGDFARQELPTELKDRLQYNHAQSEWYVRQAGSEVEAVEIGRGNKSSMGMEVVPFGAGYLLLHDRGEFGGGLWICSGGVSQGLINGNFRNAFMLGGRTFVLDGLDHLGLRSGCLWEIKDAGEAYELVPLAVFGEQPSCCCEYEGCEYILTGHGIWRFDGMSAERLPGVDLNVGLYYPNNVKIIGGVLYSGMRGGILEVNLDTLHMSWWVPTKDFLERLARGSVKEEIMYGMLI